MRKLLLGSVAALFVVGISATAQMWYPFPQVGGPAFCSSTVNSTCVNTVPAGPTITGFETVPADTNISGGSSPQTVKLPVTSIGAGPYQFNAPATGASLTVMPQERRLILVPAGTIALLSVTLPPATSASGLGASLVDGQLWGICSTQIVTSLILTAGTGTTIANKPTALAVPTTTGAGGGCYEFVYRLANTTWYRVQ